jgi:predicted 3-demethylubiquinone-9 3-methyltransferase (glyoxalase superfamily)
MKKKPKAQKITTWLWFDTQAEEAAKFYTKIFKRSKITKVTKYGDAGPMPKGTVLTVEFKLDGVPFAALNGGATHQFTPAISLSVDCKTQKEIDYFWEKLGEGGREDMCGWLQDKYGVSWQIVPSILPDLLFSKKTKKANRAMQAMLQMRKLDIKKLKHAFDNAEAAAPAA